MVRRVLYIELSGQIEGGGHRSLLQLLQHLDRHQYRPLVLCPAEGSLVNRLQSMGVSVEFLNLPRLRGPLAPVHAVPVLLRLHRFLKARQVDLVHVTAPRAALLAGAAAGLARIPMIWHVRIARSDGVYDRLNVQLARAVVVISEAVRKRFASYGNPGKIHLIHNGVDPQEFVAGEGLGDLRERFQVQETFLVGTVGQILPEKGHDELLQAAAVLRDEFPDVHFLIVGNENAYTRELKRRVQAMGLAGTVHFQDFMTDIVGLYNTLDAVAVPSHHEAFGRVIIEAMACGKPVVTTFSGAGREIIEDGVDGVLVPPRDGQALAKALRELVVDERRRTRLAAAGREKVLRRFHIAEHARKVEALYDALLAGSHPARSREIHTAS